MSTTARHRAGFVAILGRTNAGKSTLLNRLLGEKIAITTPKAQTTRSRILGIVTRDDAQLLLLDTPGLHRGGKLLNQALREIVDSTLADCDAALLLLDPAEGWDEEQARLLAELERRGRPCLIALNKCDRWQGEHDPLLPPELLHAHEPVRISALHGEGVETLLERLVALLPESPALYPADQVSDRSLRFLAAEFVREAAFEALEQEIPYSLAVEVVDFEESDGAPVRIRAHLLVERESQKGIVIGRGGAVVKRIGIQARRAIEGLLGTQVHLELRVVVEPHWARDPRRRRALGYD